MVHPRVAAPEAAPRGFTLIEMMIVTVIIAILMTIAALALGRVRLAAEIAAVATESRQLYIQFNDFYVDNGMYPNATSNPFFQLDTFEPLNYAGSIHDHIVDHKADAYDSPDDRGNNQEFYVLMTLRRDPTIRFVVASSDNCPLSNGEWLEGVYMYRNGRLMKSFGKT